MKSVSFCKIKTIYEEWKNAAGYHPGPVMPSTSGGALLNKTRVLWLAISAELATDPFGDRFTVYLAFRRQFRLEEEGLRRHRHLPEVPTDRDDVAGDADRPEAAPTERAVDARNDRAGVHAQDDGQVSQVRHLQQSV